MTEQFIRVSLDVDQIVINELNDILDIAQKCKVNPEDWCWHPDDKKMYKKVSKAARVLLDYYGQGSVK